jgi:hypothetical protein
MLIFINAMCMPYWLNFLKRKILIKFNWLGNLSKESKKEVIKKN